MTPTDRTAHVAESIRVARARKRIGLRQLAANMTEAGYPISHSALHRIENGKTSPTIELLAHLEDVLGVDIARLFSGTDDTPALSPEIRAAIDAAVQETGRQMTDR